MSSQDHERLLEGSPDPAAPSDIPRPRRTTRSTPEKSEGTRARTRSTARAKAGNEAGTPAASATSRKTAAGARAKAATATSAVVRAATAKAVSARSAVARGATTSAAAKARAPKPAVTRSAVKPAVTEATAGKAAVASPAPGPAGAKVSTATPAAAGPAATRTLAAPARKKAAPKATAPKASVLKATTQKSPAAPSPAAGSRPTPYPRTPAAVPTAAAPVEQADPLAGVTLRIVGRHRRPASPHRRPAVLLAAALVGTLGIGAFSVATSSSEANARASAPVSVAHELGLTAHTVEGPAPAIASRQLGLLAASRAHREAEQVAAARAQRVADARAIEAARPKAVLPVKGAVLTSGFGYRWGTLHAGIDLAAPLGTPEYAVMDGVVLKAGPASGFGQAVYIQHANGDVTVYGHMEKILVTTGQVVKAGQEIALLGAEGEATGPHLHLEVHVGGIEGPKIDPIPWLAARGVHV